MASLTNQTSRTKTSRSKAIKRGDHNAFTLFHPAWFLLAISTPFLGTIRSTLESRRFSLETDIRVWKNTVRCFIKNNSKKPAEKNDLRQIVIFKMIIYFFICFLILFRGRSHDTGMAFIPERVHSIPIYFSVSVYMIPRRKLGPTQVIAE